jgi:transposase
LNTAKLRGIIAEKGYSQREVAKHIGITEKTFYAKMKKGVFGTDEATAMIQLLQIENPADIFLHKE